MGLKMVQGKARAEEGVDAGVFEGERCQTFRAESRVKKLKPSVVT